MIKKLIIFISLIITLDAYVINDEKYIKDAVLKYDYGIIKMAMTGETDFFKPFVKKEIVTKLMLWVKSWHDNNLVMRAQINDIVFLPIQYNEDNATITTMEDWTFNYYNIATKKLAHDNVDIYYKMQFTLQKKDDNWMIVEVKHIEEKETTKK